MTMEAQAQKTARAGRTKAWLALLAFAAAYLAVRLPWLPCDPGIRSAWEYGYNATDEGYYIDGGKEKFLWGSFVDLPRGEAFTYGYSPGTHWISYVAHLLFGQSTWAWRIPFLLACLLAWAAVFRHLSKRAGPVAAFALCAPVSLVPMVVAYERTASNDALIGAMLALAYVCATGRTRTRIALAGVLTGAIALFKPSVWVLVPIAAAGAADGRDFRSCAKDVALFVCVAVASAFAWKLVAVLAAVPDAARAGVSAWELVKRTTTHYPLPPLLDLASHFKGISAFPRDPSIQLLAAVAPLLLSIPFAAALRCALARRWNGRVLLFLAIPAYVAAVSVMNTLYTHYFLPAIMILPVALFEIADEMEKCAGPAEPLRWKKALPPLLAVAALCATGTLFLAAQSVPPAESQGFYSRIYNLPQHNVWGMTWPALLAFVAASVACISYMQGFAAGPAGLAAWAAAAFVAASVAFAPLPAAQLAPYMKRATAEYFAPAAVSTALSALFLAAAFGFRERVPWRKAVAWAAPLCVLACYLATPNWRAAAADLARPGTHVYDSVAKELAAILPQDAIVLGERSNQMLLSLPVRTATTFAASSNPIPVVESILAAEPEAKLYALLDTQHSYCLRHFQEHAAKYRLRLVKTFKMPSFADGSPVDVHLAAIEPAKGAN